MFLPSPSDLLANLSNCREQVVSMLTGDIPSISTLIVAISQSSINKDKFTPVINVSTTADLPELFNGSQETENCLGAALQAAYKMVSKI